MVIYIVLLIPTSIIITINMDTTFYSNVTYPITHSNVQTIHTHVNSHQIYDDNVPDTYYKSCNRYFSNHLKHLNF